MIRRVYMDSKNFVVVLCLALACGSLESLRADDWPQWMGPQRDNIWRETGIIDKIPETGLRVVWSVDVAGGYAGPAVAGGRVFVADYVSSANVKVDNFDRKEFTGTERVVCLDEATGKMLWKHEYPVKYTVSYPAGPRVTPTVDGDRVYSLGAEGDLFCFDAASGKIRWSKDLKTEYKTKAALWGYASHPLIDGKKLICIAGGDGTHTVALDKLTGKELWRNGTAPEQGYSPPLIIRAGGKRQLILVHPKQVRAVDPETGIEFWSTPYDADNGSIIMTPVHWKDYLFVGGFSNKNLLLKLRSDQPGAEVVWKDVAKLGISPVNVQPQMDGDTLFGFDQDGQLMGVDLPSGKRLFETAAPIAVRKQGSGTAFIIRHENRYILFNELGEVVLCQLSPSGYKELGRTKVIEPTNNAFGRDVVWCSPAFANRKMFVRNDSKCICVDLAASKGIEK